MWRYCAFKIAALTLAHFPWKLGYIVARVVADAVYFSSPALRASIGDNMRRVLGPEADDAALKRAVQGVLRTTARNYFDLIKIPHMSLEDIENRMTLHGWHHVEEAVGQGKGVIFVTAHLGSFDLGAQILAVRSVKTTIPVEPLEPPILLRHVTKLRNSKGISFVPAQSGVLQVLLQSLRAGEAIVLACDRDVGGDGLESDFFGERTTLPTLAVRLAMRTGAIVVPALNLRRERSSYDAYFGPAVDMVPGGNGAVESNVEQVVRILEKYIRMCPEQWVVIGPIWANAH